MSDLPTKEEVERAHRFVARSAGDYDEIEREEMRNAARIIRSLAAHVPCERCGGEGRVETAGAYHMPIAGEPETIMVEKDCPSCKGSGKAYDLEVE